MNLSVTWSPSAGEKCEQQILFPLPFGEHGDISADVLSVFQTQRGETWFSDREVYVGTSGIIYPYSYKPPHTFKEVNVLSLREHNNRDYMLVVFVICVAQLCWLGGQLMKINTL